MNKETGGPAFPVPLTDAQEAEWNKAKLPSANGMTLRDYFAAKAMQALVEKSYFDTAARLAYEMADEMMKARVQSD